MKLLYNYLIWSRIKNRKKHSLGVMTWAENEHGRMIWAYESAIKISCHLAKPKWYFLHSYLPCPENWENPEGKWLNEMIPNLVDIGYMVKGRPRKSFIHNGAR